MNLKITYHKKQAGKFLRKNSHVIPKSKIENLLRKAVDKIYLKKDTNLDMITMKGGYSEFYRIRSGNIRIIFSVSTKGEVYVVFVVKVGYRQGVYKA